ncbi:MAG: hypothetical protein V1734_02500 [Nanoarchaeota archaeon]
MAEKIRIRLFEGEYPVIPTEMIEVRLGDRIGTSICGYLKYSTDYSVVITSSERPDSLYDRGSITLNAEDLKGASIRRLKPGGWSKIETIVEGKRKDGN